LDGDHFVLLKQAAQVQSAICDWIMQQETPAQISAAIGLQLARQRNVV
jgi:hypothetical protein